MIFSVSGFEKPTIRAIRPPKEAGGEPELVWEQKRSVPMIPSFLYVNQRLFGITEGGVAVCLNAADGSILWQERVGGNHYASPVTGENRIYFTSDEGETTVIQGLPEFKILSKNPLKGKTQASMAISQGNIFLRTGQELFCIGGK